jgi:hypothetical protein
MIENAETAAEARDPGALRELVADDYHDADGRDADEIRRYVRAQVTVGMLGRESDSTWDLAADIQRFDLRLAREDGAWRVTRASWQAVR